MFRKTQPSEGAAVESWARHEAEGEHCLIAMFVRHAWWRSHAQAWVCIRIEIRLCYRSAVKNI